MLSEKEKQEMRELAASETIREEFCLLRKHSHQHATLDHFIRFLNCYVAIEFQARYTKSVC
jgi:hypothetical protein